jgi:aspartate aminotransferase-like enzyme
MKPEPPLPAARDKLLFTPGPLTTSLSVKQAMLHDAGSWHYEFNAVVGKVREQRRTCSASGPSGVFSSRTFGLSWPPCPRR